MRLPTKRSLTRIQLPESASQVTSLGERSRARDKIRQLVESPRYGRSEPRHGESRTIGLIKGTWPVGVRRTLKLRWLGKVPWAEGEPYLAQHETDRDRSSRRVHSLRESELLASIRRRDFVFSLW